MNVARCVVCEHVRICNSTVYTGGCLALAVQYRIQEDDQSHEKGEEKICDESKVVKDGSPHW